jgi:2-polyprenyl-3-methyl-5-hydroxy-6-metoxy-1,4-benzoquinol methylase
MGELRPDLEFASVDIAGRPPNAPPATVFAQADLQTDELPWPAASFDAITCMHVVEHLGSMTNLWKEIARLLKAGGTVYIETPGPESVRTPSPPASLQGKITMNFYDDPTHVHPVEIATLRESAQEVGLQVTETGRSRNLLFAAAYPLLCLISRSRKRYVAKLHWLGWSVYLIAKKPAA